MVNFSFGQNSMGNECIIPMGTVGVGKSTVMNAFLGKQYFATSSKPQGCTHDFSLHTYEEGKAVMDVPGLNDPAWPLDKWLSKF